MLLPMKKVLFFFILSSFSFDTFYFVPVFGDTFDNGFSITDKLIKLEFLLLVLHLLFAICLFACFVCLFCWPFFALVWSLYFNSVLGFPYALS